MKSFLSQKLSSKFVFPCLAFVTVLFIIVPAYGQHSLPTRHVRPVVADGEAKLVGPLADTQLMHVDIVLPLRNQADLTALLGRLYDPSSPDYRHFLGVAQFTAQFGPTAEDYQTVVAWAQANGFTVGNKPANNLLVPITGTVAQANSAFHVTMNVYQHPTENRTFFSPDRNPR